MNQIFLNKIQYWTEALFLFITISWQPLFGCIASAAAIWYYTAMLKKNVIDIDYKGSWRKYLKSFLKKKK